MALPLRPLWLLTAALALVPGCARDAAPVNAGAELPAPPSATDVLAAAVRASGGEEALRAHQSCRMTGTFSMAAQGITGQMTLWSTAQGQVYSRVELEGIGRMEEGVDGGVPWSKDPLTGPRIKEGVEAVQALRAADFHQLLNLATHYPSAETVGRGTLEGAAVYELRLTPTEGPPETWYFDVQSGLPVGSKVTLQTAMGDVTVTSVNSDFREIGGQVVPTQTTMTNSLMSTSIRWTEIVWDPPDLGMPPLPDDVRALIPPAASP